jgi:monoamine oxidase
MEQLDVLVIGAGAAGMMAAAELAAAGKTVAVLEAHKQSGGRMRTVAAGNDFFELGAEFVHGNLPLTKELAQKGGIPLYTIAGSIWQHHEGRLKKQDDFIENFEKLEEAWKPVNTDLSVKEFLEHYLEGSENESSRFSVKNYVEGYYAADISKASLFALREELSKEDEDQYRLEGGYGRLVNYLEQWCRQLGVKIYFNYPVWQLNWTDAGVEAVTASRSVHARKVIVTVSIGVLQKGNITFSPALPQKNKAAAQLGFGHVIKTNFLWQEPFWKNKHFTQESNLADLGFLFSDAVIPTWWTRQPKGSAVLAGWRGGPGARSLALLNDVDIYERSLSSLAEIVGTSEKALRQFVQAKGFYNWTADPFFEGAYSYAVVNGSAFIEQLREPVANTLYFAGEGLHHGPEIGTVEAALQSGRETAQYVMAAF